MYDGDRAHMTWSTVYLSSAQMPGRPVCTNTYRHDSVFEMYTLLSVRLLDVIGTPTSFC